MKNSLRYLLVPFAAAILGIGVPSVASADPVTITSGRISMPVGSTASSPTQVEGTDGVLPFLFIGFISSASAISPRSCCLPTATMISLEIGHGAWLAGAVV
jgi:hypothetical protein